MHFGYPDCRENQQTLAKEREKIFLQMKSSAGDGKIRLLSELFHFLHFEAYFDRTQVFFNGTESLNSLFELSN